MAEKRWMMFATGARKRLVIYGRGEECGRYVYERGQNNAFPILEFERRNLEAVPIVNSGRAGKSDFRVWKEKGLEIRWNCKLLSKSACT
jgi:hypothetical protein